MFCQYKTQHDAGPELKNIIFNYQWRVVFTFIININLHIGIFFNGLNNFTKQIKRDGCHD
ncbi:hypothetical protein H744_1c1584 [Photobacterium gaetbulicola Gung47]|uniref:Uncharacterized protein n=1 Tax=Photobacterium gaetbulicola Gung47 TaxID=658445 RepID=A0A0C5WK46_9GAMM|nr:hypothetical protein H744_1c1584 [Photobacterium gaetbulicola Gung47]